MTPKHTLKIPFLLRLFYANKCLGKRILDFGIFFIYGFELGREKVLWDAREQLLCTRWWFFPEVFYSQFRKSDYIANLAAVLSFIFHYWDFMNFIWLFIKISNLFSCFSMKDRGFSGLIEFTVGFTSSFYNHINLIFSNEGSRIRRLNRLYRRLIS